MAKTSLQTQIEAFVADEDENGRIRDRSPKTKHMYESVLIEIFLPWATKTGIADAAQVDDVAMDRFTGFLQHKKRKGKDGKEKGLSVSSIRSYVRHVRVFLNHCGVARGKYRPPKPAKRNERDKSLGLPTRQEIDRMEKAADNERDKLIVRTLADTGMRLGELLNLKGSDILERPTSNRHKGHWLRVDGKTGEHQTPIESQLAVRLARLSEHNEQRGKGSDYLFMTNRKSRETGKYERLQHSAVEQMVRHLAEEVGIEKRIYPHLFRHAFITECRERGIEMRDLKQWMGHSSYQMIQEVYDHPTDSDAHAALKKLFARA